MKAMILAAGLGTRLKPFTDNKPKALFEVEGHTLLEWTIRYLKKYGVDELVINVHHFPDQVIEYLEQNKGFGLPCVISDERDNLMDTGGAIVQASKYLKGSDPFILMGIDVITGLDLGEMLRFHKEKKPLVTLGVKDRVTSRSLLFDSTMRLTGWRDNRSGEMKGEHDYAFALGFSVVHIIQPEIFNLITETGAFSIMDLYLRLMYSEKILGFRHDKSGWFEFGRSEAIGPILANPEFQRLLRSY